LTTCIIGIASTAVTANIANIRAQSVRGIAEHECRARRSQSRRSRRTPVSTPLTLNVNFARAAILQGFVAPGALRLRNHPPLHKASRDFRPALRRKPQETITEI
jgi:hypothetical protein